MRNILLCLLLVSGLARGAEPQPDPEALVAARELVDLLDVERTMTGIRTSILEGAAQMAGDNPPPEAKAILDRYTAQMFDELVAFLDHEETAARLYAEHFTTDELNELVAFYRSPLGSKLLVKLPVLMEQTAAISNVKFQEFMPRMQELSNAMAAELDALRYPDEEPSPQ